MSDKEKIDSLVEEDELDGKDPTELQEVLKELPVDLVKNLPTIVSRLNAFITFYSTLNLKRLSKLTNFVVKAEEVLFDEDTILNQDTESLKENYRQAKTASLEILDLARKVAIQIPHEDSANKEVDEVYKLLKSLSPEAVSDIKNHLLGFKSSVEDD